MDKKKRLSWWLALLATILLWFPIAAIVIISAVYGIMNGSLMYNGIFMVDYLIPAELFLVVSVGALLLLWAAIRSKKMLIEVIVGCVLGLIGLGLGQGMAVWTGLAHGDTEPSGWPWITVLGLIILYDLAVVFLAIVGTRLTIFLGKK
jgi:hypothetical protein